MVRYVDTALRPDEKILYDAKVHWAIFLGPVARLIAIWVFVGIAYVSANLSKIQVSVDETAAQTTDFQGLFNLFSHGDILFSLAGLIGLGAFIPALIYYYNSDFVLTDRRVIAKFGLLSRSTSEQRLSKVESIHVYQSLLGRLLNYGTVTVTGTGSSITKFGPMVDPIDCKHAIEGQLDLYRGDRAA